LKLEVGGEWKVADGDTLRLLLLLNETVLCDEGLEISLAVAIVKYIPGQVLSCTLFLATGGQGVWKKLHVQCSTLSLSSVSLESQLATTRKLAKEKLLR